MYILCMIHMYIYIYIYICLHEIPSTDAKSTTPTRIVREKCIVINVCMCIHIHIYMYIYVYMCIYIYIYTYVYIYIYITATDEPYGFPSPYKSNGKRLNIHLFPQNLSTPIHPKREADDSDAKIRKPIRTKKA